jgi:hypothetical protein
MIERRVRRLGVVSSNHLILSSATKLDFGRWNFVADGRARRAKFRGSATKFPSSRPRKFRGAQIRPRNSRVFLTPHLLLQPYSEVGV